MTVLFSLFSPVGYFSLSAVLKKNLCSLKIYVTRTLFSLYIFLIVSTGKKEQSAKALEKKAILCS